MMNRRRFLLSSLAGALAAPLGCETQQAGRVPRLGYLANSSAESPADSAFLHGLRDLGWVDGRTILVDARYVGARSEQIPEVARDLVSRGVNVIATWSPRAVVAVQQATATIPIVGMSMGDPVALGVAASFARPGGNVTGVADLQEALQAKRVEILKETIPGIRRLAVLANPDQTSTVEYVKHVNVATRALGLQVELLNVSSPNELGGAFAGISRRRADALLVLPDGMFWAVRADIVGLAARQRVPAIYWERAYAEAGGLLSYAASLSDIGRRGATLVDRILKGAKPGDLPVEQPTKFELVINMRTAKALGLTIPPSLLARADQVIESWDRRRFLMTFLAAALAATPVAEAQTPRPYRVAMLAPFSTAESVPYRDAFFDAMRALGYVDGRNVIFDVRISDRDRARVPAMVDELIALQPDVPVGDAVTARVMRAKTTSIPIVLTASIDPIGDGLADSLRRPGMNVTGVSLFLDQLSGKHVEFMQEVLPRITRIGLLSNTTWSHNCTLIEAAAGAAARRAGALLVSYYVANRDDLVRAFSRMGKERPEVLLPCPTPMLFNNRDLLDESGLRLRVPFTSVVVASVPTGVLFSYGPRFAEGYRKAATYVDKILKGARAGDLPIEQPTTFELVINLKTAREVGLVIPLVGTTASRSADRGVSRKARKPGRRRPRHAEEKDANAELVAVLLPLDIQVGDRFTDEEGELPTSGWQPMLLVAGQRARGRTELEPPAIGRCR